MQGHPKNQRQTPNGKATGWFSHVLQATSYGLQATVHVSPHRQSSLMPGPHSQVSMGSMRSGA